MNRSQDFFISQPESMTLCAELGDEDSLALRLQEARDGSSEALGELLESSRQFLLIVAAQHLTPDLKPKAGASDLVQETFCEAHRDFSGFQGGSHRELLSWLRVMLLNNIRDLNRHYNGVAKCRIGREVPFSERGDSALGRCLPAETESPSWCAQRRESNEVLHRVLGRLAADHRQVILLRNLELRSFEEIGSLMNRSPEAARKLWGRALVALGSQYGVDDATR